MTTTVANMANEWSRLPTLTAPTAFSTKVAEILTKGTLVELRGRVYPSAWIGKDGEPHAGLNFHTSQIKVHSSSKRIQSNIAESQKVHKKANSKSKSNDSDKEDDLPF